MSAVLDLVRVLFEPTAVFERVREKPKFLAPYLALAAVQLVIGFLQLPYIRAAMAAQIATMAQANPQAAEGAQKVAAVRNVGRAIIVALALVVNARNLSVAGSGIGGAAAYGSL